MKYMGSKSKIAKDLVPIIQKYINENHITNYIEPFCGGCNIIDKIDCDLKFASDKQKYLIALYKNLDKLDTLPEMVTREHYVKVRDSYNKNTDEFEDWYKGAVGFLASYNGRFFDGGYSGIVKSSSGVERNYYQEAKRNLEKQKENLRDIVFICSDYKSIKYISDYLVYCDPPYKNTKQYSSSKDFDSDEFWQWVRERSANNIVLVSELEAPDDFECIWEQEIKRNIEYSKSKVVTEKLFKYKPKV